ncbi:S-layer homology domain-containing protein [Bacillus sp. CGMCC 1.16541]|uniref:S-layer homology domain-containing protein n=1 Tax=Bacillus sp. CGMCC 1.16541 TaxID=2185143 RepID=UPI000D73CBAF|nr:S-layer homology domain-containing protein [Bacillus sp. CGMCC 1.16541]
MKRYITSLLVVFVLAVTLAYPFTTQAASAFKDVSLYKDEIDFLTEKQIIKGYDDGTFKPDQPIKRLQAVQMILRAMGEKVGDAPNPNFKDVKPGDYGYEEVAKAVEIGIISGKQDGRFDSWGTLTRGQMAKILVNAYNLRGIYPYQFTDVNEKHWAYDFVSPLAANNITTGYGDDTYRPNISLSRAHFAVFMARLLDSSFRPDNPYLADSLIEGIFDIKILDTDIHESKPILYLLDAIENEVVALNYETYEYESVRLPLPVEKMTYVNGKIYVTQLKGKHSPGWWGENQRGAFAVIDANSMKVEKQFNIELDPFDIAATSDGVVYIPSGSGQWTFINSYSSKTGERLSTQAIRNASYIAMHPSGSKVYSITTDLSPRNMTVYDIENGKLLSERPSPYHGDYPLSPDLAISPDGKYIFNQQSYVFRSTLNHSTDMTYAGKLDRPYKAIAFDILNNEFYTSNHQDYIQAYDYQTLKPAYQLTTYGDVQHLFYQGDTLIALTNLTFDNSSVPFVGLETITFE